ncbi:hypothetical protein E4U31_000034 [Claviceps sp. LM219 group G6]|nr:hypothetical protein E4U31_000034 [Claviceps sp. LM219 group G6]
MDEDEATLVGPQQAADVDEDGLASTPKIAFDFCAYGNDDQSSSDDSYLAQAAVDALRQLAPQSTGAFRFEVSIPALPLESRKQYEELQSNVVERVCSLDRCPSGKTELVKVEFTDGTLRQITAAQIERFENGLAALDAFYENMGRNNRKRKHGSYENCQSGSSFDESVAMDSDQAENVDEIIVNRRSRTRSSTVHVDSRAAPTPQLNGSNGSDTIVEAPRRSSRTKKLRISHSETNPRAFSDQEDDDRIPLVFSDIVSSYPRAKRRSAPSLKVRSLKAGSKAQSQLPKSRGGHDSDIEFEQPRKSSRAVRNVHYALDLGDVDDETLFRTESGPQDSPKVVSVKEIFRPIPPESRFALVHMNTCHTCKAPNNRGQFVYCQGCSFAYHKQCIGPRSARDHLATKIGEASFVLQCRFCIEHQHRYENTAPRRAICQYCAESGRSCAPFSQRKTARQEEKLREQNGGVDPWTLVREDYLNNAENVLFRCCNCQRAWHQHHLPPIGCEGDAQDQAFGAFEDYSTDWNCNECISAQHKIQRLVAWRTNQPLATPPPDFMDVSDDDKEYLVKWETKSYCHCTWMPGAWVYGVVAAVTRKAFAKHAAQGDLFKISEKEAIPEEYLLIDIILRVKLSPTAIRASSQEDDGADTSQITKVLVKFQGLGYDDVVWDTPPAKDSGDLYTAFELAYRDYLAGRNFPQSPNYKMKERIKDFRSKKHKDIAVQPAGLKRGKLMAYQIEGLNWLVSNYHQGRSVILADEMGLGKTVQVVSLVTYLVQESPKCWPFLISVPNATCPNWRREFRQWAPDLRVVTYHGGKEAQDLAYKHELFPHGSRDMAAHVVIMSYDSTQDSRTRELFSSVRWAGLVVDEGQRLKNDQNLLYQALRAMKIPFRLLLTGTPLQNNKRELFNLIQFIDQSKKATQLDLEFSVLDKETLPKLHEMIRPYFLRRTKAGVLKFLPPMTQIILPVTMTVIQERLSKSIMAKNPQLIKAIFANDKMRSKERGSLNNILMQLRKCLCHPFMYSEAIEEEHNNPDIIHRNLVEASAKLLLLEIMLPKLKERGHRVLIFSQFLQQLDIMEDFLNGIGYEYRRLDGQISSLEKQRRIDAFNEPHSTVFAFLLSTRAGGVGINLATADTVIIMDPDFNPHQDIQALSRAHRIGQKRKVLCFQLMTKDTVEERIMQIGKKKMALDHALIESMDHDDVAGDDLETILKHGAQALFADDYQKGAIVYDSPSVDKLLDRSDVEQARIEEEGSADVQFSYAKVWSNDRASLVDGLTTTAEDTAPEPVSSSVWDKILAQREEEARRQAAAKQETLGRGGRRRTVRINFQITVDMEMEITNRYLFPQANNYTSDVLAEYLQEPEGPNQSESSSDEYAAVNAAADEALASSSDEDFAVRDTTRKIPTMAKAAQVEVAPRKQAMTAKTIGQKSSAAVNLYQGSPSRRTASTAVSARNVTKTANVLTSPNTLGVQSDVVAAVQVQRPDSHPCIKRVTSNSTHEQGKISRSDARPYVQHVKSKSTHEQGVKKIQPRPLTHESLPSPFPSQSSSTPHRNTASMSSNRQSWTAGIDRSLFEKQLGHAPRGQQPVATAAGTSTPPPSYNYPISDHYIHSRWPETVGNFSESNIRVTMDTLIHSHNMTMAAKAQQLATLKHTLQRASECKHEPGKL